MTKKATIKLHKNHNAKLKTAESDTKQNADELEPIVEQIDAAYEDDFERKWATGIPIEEGFARLFAKIESLKWDKK